VVNTSLAQTARDPTTPLPPTMCRITEYRYTCTHHIVHVWSACRGQVKATKPSKTPACQKTPRLCIRLATKCGSCLRSEAERKLRRTLTWTTDHQPTEIIESILQERLNEIATQIPTTNWCPLPSPVYGRKPSQKRLLTPRKHSLLREQVKPEDACGPEAWEDNVVLPVYEAVANGWNFEWTSFFFSSSYVRVFGGNCNGFQYRYLSVPEDTTTVACGGHGDAYRILAWSEVCPRVPSEWQLWFLKMSAPR
jgi:hypothetical protein